MTNTSVLSLAVFTAEAGDTNIFARTHIWGGEGHLSFSTNNGMRWTDVSTGLPYTSACALAVFPDSTGSINLFAGTYSGVWRRSSSEMITSVHPPTSELSDEFLLLHNFSNPFNPEKKANIEKTRFFKLPDFVKCRRYCSAPCGSSPARGARYTKTQIVFTRPTDARTPN